jgi:hypothetical protein
VNCAQQMKHEECTISLPDHQLAHRPRSRKTRVSCALDKSQRSGTPAIHLWR